MTDKPIIFSAPMVRALLDGRKTQTRRVLKPQPHEAAKGCYHRPDGSWVWVSTHRENNGTGYYGNRIDDRHFFTRYNPGDRLWVREAHALGTEGGAIYREEWPGIEMRWRPSIHMPRWASRLTLTVTDVRVQRLQEIEHQDAIAEGAPVAERQWGGGSESMCLTDKTWRRVSPRLWFHETWNSIHGPDAWDASPWVVALTFDVHRCNIEQMERDK